MKSNSRIRRTALRHLSFLLARADRTDRTERRTKKECCQPSSQLMRSIDAIQRIDCKGNAMHVPFNGARYGLRLFSDAPQVAIAL
ncbi:hypothetical protein [Sinorhizobium fredii]|uniref:hypothetical protein n=1 Tax=Rhizobium fredii TaxID=380 RepID=UPI0011D1D795|nr:hypothetical protein [Sinorhizobium fredii]WOS63670.1 hypothetical protein SFGR64A_04590 [Sinorhizobium fredii GR64]